MKLISPQKLPNLDFWLKCSIKNNKPPKFFFVLLHEDQIYRNQILAHLKKIAQQAYQDFRDLIIDVYDLDLDPLDSLDVQDAKKQFRDKLDQILSIFDTNTLKGYLGETLTGLVVLGFSPFGISEWEIPVFLYRHHIHAFDAFEKWQQSGKFPKAIVGRAGEDNIAFARDAHGNITKELKCEAKCSAQHNSSLINDAHKKFDDAISVSPELFRIIQVLRNHHDAKSKAWVRALQYHRWKNFQKDVFYNLVCYVCGHVPQKPKGRLCWMDQDYPNQHYKSSRPLQVVEIHLNDIHNLIRVIYDQKVEP